MPHRDTLNQEVLPRESGRSRSQICNGTSKKARRAPKRPAGRIREKKQRPGTARRANTKRSTKDRPDEPGREPAHPVAKDETGKEKKHLMVETSIPCRNSQLGKDSWDPHGRRQRRTTPPLTCVASPPVPGWCPLLMQEQQFPIGSGTTRGRENPGPGDRGTGETVARAGEGVREEESVTGDCACRSAATSQQTGSLSGEPGRCAWAWLFARVFYVLITSGVGTVSV